MGNESNIRQVNGGRIAKNTFFLYVRMLLTMVVTLFTSRILINALGQVDYGLNNVIAGLVVVFSFVNGSLASATSRYLTYTIGAEGSNDVGRVFATSFKIHSIIALAVFVLGEIVGVVIVNCFLVIPDDRLFACNVVYQMVICMSMISIVQVPFTSMIISHERMNVYGYLGVVDALAKCGIAYLIYISTIDKLIFLGALQTAFAICMLLFYVWYCKRCFGSQVRFRDDIDKSLTRQMLGYTSWSIMGSAASMLKNHGVTLLINGFFGPVVNAANAVAYQVNAAVMQFTSNFTLAMNPQIIKSYAAGQTDDMKRLLMRGGKLSFFMLLYLCLPLFLETEQILHLWLKVVPDYAVVLTRLVLLLTMVESFNYTIVCAVQATGNIRDYQIWVSGITMLNFPLTYLCYKMGCVPQAALMVSVAVSTFTLFVRLYFLKKQLGISPREYITKVVLRTWGVAIICFVAPMTVLLGMESSLWRILMVVMTVVVSNSAIIWLLGIDSSERLLLKQMVGKLLNGKTKE